MAMNYEEALAIRDQFLASDAWLSTGATAEVKHAGRTKASVSPPPAVGVQHWPDGTYGVAVRIQQRTLQSDSLVAQLRAEYGAENVDERVTGPIFGLGLGDLNRPLIIGCSSAHKRVGHGTLGCFVTRGGATFALSNNHVYARANSATLGDDVLQPSFDDDPSGKVIGTLADFVKLELTGNKVDAAIAEIAVGIGCDKTTLAGFGKPLKPPTGAPLTGNVHKVGRMSDLTAGLISASALIPVSVEINGRFLGFVDQIEITSTGGPFSVKGDSGSVVFDDEGAAVGLLFGGNEIDTSYANPIGIVFSKLGVQLAT